MKEINFPTPVPVSMSPETAAPASSPAPLPQTSTSVAIPDDPPLLNSSFLVFNQSGEEGGLATAVPQPLEPSDSFLLGEASGQVGFIQSAILVDSRPL